MENTELNADSEYESEKEQIVDPEKEIEDQFSKNLKKPNITKEYKISKNIKTTGITLLMKCILLSKKYPHLLDNVDIKKELEKQTTSVWKGTALHICLMNVGFVSSELAIQKLLENKVNLDAIDSNGNTALIYAVDTPNSESFVKMIIDAKANLDIQCINGNNALMHASNNSRNLSTEKTVKMLIDANANLDMQNSDGDTVLIIASSKSNKDSTENTVKMLIDAKANVNLQNNNANTALIIASCNTNDTSTENTVQMLIEAKCNLDLQNQKNYTALTAAFRKVNKSTENTVKMLISAKADLNLDSYYGTALMMAVGPINTNLIVATNDIVKMLIEEKCNINLKNQDGKSALDILYYTDKNSPLIEYFLEKEAQHDIKDIYKNNCIMYKKRLDEKEIVKDIFKAGLSLPECTVISYL